VEESDYASPIDLPIHSSIEDPKKLVHSEIYVSNAEKIRIEQEQENCQPITKSLIIRLSKYNQFLLYLFILIY